MASKILKVVQFRISFFSHSFFLSLALVGLAFLGSIGLLFLFLACALPQYDNWWPFFTVVFYLLAPLPTLFARRHSDDLATSSALREFCTFLTTGIVISAFALPIVLARAPTSDGGHVVSQFQDLKGLPDGTLKLTSVTNSALSM